MPDSDPSNTSTSTPCYSGKGADDSRSWPPPSEAPAADTQHNDERCLPSQQER